MSRFVPVVVAESNARLLKVILGVSIVIFVIGGFLLSQREVEQRVTCIDYNQVIQIGDTFTPTGEWCGFRRVQ